MESYLQLFDKLLAFFPDKYQFLVSLALVVLIIYILYRLLKISLVWLALLVVLVPASIPIIRVGTISLFSFFDAILKR